MKTKGQVLLSCLLEFYEDPENLQKLTTILQHCTTKTNIPSSPKISLRLIDWLVTNYSKADNLVLMNGDQPLNLFLSYKSQLRSYSKRFFDCFARGKQHTVTITDSNGDKLMTTIAQLNFFRWYIRNRIFDYLNRNSEMVERDMVASIKQRAALTVAASSGNEMRKRHELSKAKIKCGMTTMKVDVRIKF
jgi:hypothetical protein